MDFKKQQTLYDTFPNLYRQHKLPITQSCMGWGFSCGDGWYDLIYELSKKLEAKGNVEATQVKEKYGTLRFYYSGGDEETDSLIKEAEEKSAVTCESCGKPGSLTGKGWVTTLCQECFEER